MARPSAPVDFNSEGNHIFLNPRWPSEDFQTLYRAAVQAQQEKKLSGHVWFSTSGSTAESAVSVKLVALSKKALLTSARAVNTHLEVTSSDIWTQVLPLFHVGGFGIQARAYLSGSKVVPALLENRWDPAHYHRTVTLESCTLSALVPAQVYDLVAANLLCPSSMRAVVVGGGVLEQDLFFAARNLGWPLLPSYGMTETSSQIATAKLCSLESAVYPEICLLPHAKARRNAEGFLQISAESLLTCYAQNISGVLSCWDPKVDSWFTTEDQGEVQGGCISVFGRSKDYLKIGGEATNLTRLRSILQASAMQLNAHWPLLVTLLDMPSVRLGSEIHIVSQLGPRETELICQRFEQQVLPFEKPRKIHYIDQIPRSELGKILWAELRRKL